MAEWKVQIGEQAKPDLRSGDVLIRMKAAFERSMTERAQGKIISTMD